MTESFSALFATRIALTHRWLLEAASDLDEAQLQWRPAPTAPAVGFHLWHAARWSDRLQSVLPRMLGGDTRPEIWIDEHFADRWALDPSLLGFAATGMGMDEGQSADVPFAGRELLLGYAGRAFEVCDQAVAGMVDAHLTRSGPNVMYEREDEVLVSATLLNHISHITRHLGMVEALKGVSGQRGTATL